MSEKQTMVILNLIWKNHQKKLYLGMENSEFGKKKYGEALSEIESVGETIDNWDDFYSKALEIFKSHNIVRVDY